MTSLAGGAYPVISDVMSDVSTYRSVPLNKFLLETKRLVCPWLERAKRKRGKLVGVNERVLSRLLVLGLVLVCCFALSLDTLDSGVG